MNSSLVRSGTQIQMGNWLVTVGTQPAGANPTAPPVAVGTATDAEVALGADGALVDGGVDSDYDRHRGGRRCFLVAGPVTELAASVAAI